MSLGIGIGLHWLVIGWTCGSKARALHVIFRTVAVSVLWFLFPALNYTGLPFVASGIYILTVLQLRGEVKQKQAIIGTGTVS